MPSVICFGATIRCFPPMLLLGTLATHVLAQDSQPGRLVVKPSDSPQPITLYSSSHALVIGIDNYADGWSRLNKAVEDAVAIGDELERHGFNVRLVVDKKVRTASGRAVSEQRIDRAKLVNEIEEFVYTLGREPDARLLIWFAGHGHTIDNIGYLVPTGAPNPLNEPPVLRSAAEATFRRHAVSMQRFSEYMREIKSRHVLTIFDSCFSGSGFGTRGNEPTVPDGAAVTLSAQEPVRHRIASGDERQIVADDGKFRSYVIDALRGQPDGRGLKADQNGDGFVTATELGRHIISLTSYYSPQLRQSPQSAKMLDNRFDRGEFVFRVVPDPKTTASAAAPKSTDKGSEFNDFIGRLFKQAESVPVPPPQKAAPLPSAALRLPETSQPSVAVQPPSVSNKDAERAWKTLSVESKPEEFEAFAGQFKQTAQSKKAIAAAGLAREMLAAEAEVALIDGQLKDLDEIAKSATLHLEVPPALNESIERLLDADAAQIALRDFIIDNKSISAQRPSHDRTRSPANTTDEGATQAEVASLRHHLDAAITASNKLQKSKAAAQSRAAVARRQLARLLITP